jgi:hypothetical protein
MSRTEKIILTLFPRVNKVMDQSCSFSARWTDCQFSYVMNLIVLSMFLFAYLPLMSSFFMSLDS